MLVRTPLRVIRAPATDSRRWDRFEPRDGDIIIATYRKSGTTWMQRIVDLLVFQSPDVRMFGEYSLWLESAVFPIEKELAALKAQTHRRYLKSHLPFDALPVWDSVKYIHVGRDPRDSRLSWHNHEQGFRPEMRQRVAAQAAAFAAKNGGPIVQQRALPEDPRTFLLQWMDELEAASSDAASLSDSTVFGFEASYWRERNRPNLLLVHYDDLRMNLADEMRRISQFIEIDTPEDLLPKLVGAARFDSMKRDGDAMFPGLRRALDGGADRFLNKGTSGRWRDYMTVEDTARYDSIIRRLSSPGLAAWLAGGRFGASDPRSCAD